MFEGSTERRMTRKNKIIVLKEKRNGMSIKKGRKTKTPNYYRERRKN